LMLSILAGRPWFTSTWPVAGSRPDAGRMTEPVTETARLWLRIDQAQPLFSLEPAPPNAASPEMRRFGATDARGDLFVIGDPAGGAPFSRLMTERVSAASPEPGSFYLTLAREAAASGLGVTRLSMQGTAMSRFSIVETAALVLATPLGPTACMAFRGPVEEGPLRFAGWTCGAEEAGMRHAVRCLIDSLGVAKTAGDSALTAFFQTTEGARDPSCSTHAAPEGDMNALLARLEKKKSKRS
jgi:hypothetical protein